ncbi:MAG: hypothetical protein HOP15_07285 [Planctomycetes bacterium]|nr:hypothetical protein [Planctomycetota bacterium]
MKMWSKAAELAARTPGSRNRYVDFLGAALARRRRMTPAHLGVARLVVASIVILAGVSGAQERPSVPAKSSPLAAFLRDHARPPQDYLVGEFADHDVVFVGERHWVRQDVEFVQSLIPKLHAAGVHLLAIEFARHDDQAALDALVTAPKYDEVAARDIFFRANTTWGYVEYIDLCRRAWELNHALPEGAPRFRILGLNYSPDWSHLRAGMTDADWKLVWNRGSSDEYMGSVILSEIVEKGEKALVYCGRNHAFTRYRQPETDETNSRMLRWMKRAGNIVYEKIQARACTILLHAPVTARNRKSVKVAQGGLDAAFAEIGNPAKGFDLVDTPAGALEEQRAYYGVGYEHFRMQDWCDGYVFIAPLDRLAGVCVDPLFVTKENLEAARAGLGSLNDREELRSIDDFLRSMRESADIPAAMRRVE